MFVEKKIGLFVFANVKIQKIGLYRRKNFYV